MLIKAYGQFWNPDIVELGAVGAGNKGVLKGEVKFDDSWKPIDFWGAKGIYVLYSDFKAIYVGKAMSTPIGKRLRDHLSDRFAGRWDMFSFFSASSPRKTQGDVSRPGRRSFTPETIVDTLEALAILISDPALNRKRESLKDAHEAIQPSGALPRSIRSYLEELLNKVNDL